MNYYGILELGSNSVKLLVALPIEKQLRIIYEDSKVTSLGKNLGYLAKESLV